MCGRWFVTIIAIIALLYAGRGLARADIVHLKNGQQIEGDVEVAGGKLIVRTTAGAVVQFTSDEVERVEHARSAREVYRERLERLEAGDLRGHKSLAGWAKAQRLRSEVRALARKILEIDPNDPFARAELGFVVFENRWVLETELERQRVEQGFVKFRGEWMREEERARRVREEDRGRIADLMESVRATNRYVQRYAVEQLMAMKEPHHREIFAGYVDHADEMVRIVAISALTNFRGAKDAAERALVERLVRRLTGPEVAMPSDAERKAIGFALRLIDPEAALGAALDHLKASTRADRARANAIAIAKQCLRKAWVPDVCRALVVERGGRRVEAPAVRELLVEVLGVDLGADPNAWIDWWNRNASRFRDEP